MFCYLFVELVLAFVILFLRDKLSIQRKTPEPLLFHYCLGPNKKKMLAIKKTVIFIQIHTIKIHKTDQFKAISA